MKTFGFNSMALRNIQPKIALCLKIALLAAEPMSFGHLGLLPAVLMSFGHLGVEIIGLLFVGYHQR